jgi:hypothetical protein
MPVEVSKQLRHDGYLFVRVGKELVSLDATVNGEGTVSTFTPEGKHR